MQLFRKPLFTSFMHQPFDGRQIRISQIIQDGAARHLDNFLANPDFVYFVGEVE